MNVVSRYLGGALIAFEFLTPLRLRRVQTYDDRVFAEALGWYPVAGLLIGALLVLADRGLSHLLPPGPTAVLLVALLALASGGLHLDGVADTADGMALQGDRAARLGVMSEGNTGPAGVMALLLVLLAEWAAIAALPDSVRVPSLLLAPLLARWTVVPVGILFRSARPRGLGHAMQQGLWPVAAPLATRSSVSPTSIVCQVSGRLARWRATRSRISSSSGVSVAMYVTARSKWVASDSANALLPLRAPPVIRVSSPIAWP